MSPSFSHDGRRIAFVTNRDGNTAGFHLYTMNVDGSEQRRIYPKEALVFSPAWLSVDEVLFAGNRTDDGNFELFYLSIGDPESERQLTSQRLSDLQRAVSPDGNKIIFNSDRSGKIALYTIDLSSN